MKKIFSLLTIGATMLFALASCENPEMEITQVDYSRVLTPTGLDAVVTAAGDVVSFNWNKAKGATSFELEVYTNPEFSGNAFYSKTIGSDALPHAAKLAADESFYFRVRGVDENNKLKPSNWANYIDEDNDKTPKAIKTYAIKSSVNPKVIERGQDCVTIGWTLPEGDSEISHILVKTADGKETEFPVSTVGTDIKVTGLQPSNYYSFTVCFKSANRGSVAAWTRPSTDGSFVTCADTAAFKQAIKDNATHISLAYSEKAYVMGEIKISGDMIIVGESGTDGSKPTVAGRFTANSDLTSIHLEDLNFSGAEVAAEEDGTGGMSIQTHLFTAAAGTYSNVEFININVEGYQRGLYYDNSGAKVTGQILLDGVRTDAILGSGGDNIDIRKAGTVGSLIIRNSTFNEGTRTFLRVDKNQDFGEVLVENCTFNNMCYDGSALVIGGSNVQGIFAVKSNNGKYEVRNNLFLNNNCWLVGSNTDCKVPTFNKNYVYNSVGEFYTSAKLDGTGARADLSKDIVLAEGGVELAEDPCKDSKGGIFNITESSVLSAKVGDPRWYQEYIYVPEDLTQEVTKAIHTWNFSDTKTFYKMADVDMVRDGIRFYVKENPVIFENGLKLSAATSVEGCIPVDCGFSIKVNQPGSVVLSTASYGDEAATLIVCFDGKAKSAVVVGAANQIVSFPDIVEGEEHMLYFHSSGPIAVTALQWNNEKGFEPDVTLATPSPKSDVSSVTQGEDVTLSWDAVDNAGSYSVSIDGGAAKSVSECEYVVKTGSLEAGAHTASVVAVPAATDLIRKASKAASVKFSVKEKPAPTPGGIAGKIVFDDYVGNTPATIEDGSLKIDINNAIGKLTIDSNTAFFNPASPVKFTTRLKTGSKSGDSNGITITIAEGASGKLKIYARTGSNNATDRNIVVTGNGGEIINHVLLDSEKTTGVVIAGEDSAKDVYPVLEADITAGKYDVTYPVNSVNIYCLEFVPGASKVDKIWDFSSESWTSAMTSSGIAININNSDWNIEIGGLKMVAGGGSIKYNKTSDEAYYWQAGGAGSASKRYFELTADVAGTVSVWASNTGDSEDLTRKVAVKVGDADPEEIAGGYAANSGPHQLDFNVGAGTIKIYPTGNGLRFYKIEFHSK